ncbi:MAG: PfkB family carbohydrate kinase [Anaerolineae bacterium]
MTLEPVDYLVLGHLTADLTPYGQRLGGTAAYSALTARALGLRVGVVTAVADDVLLAALEGIPLIAAPSEHTTTFENIMTPHGRRQVLHQRATPLSFDLVPPAWRKAEILHLGPVAQEVPAEVPPSFSASLIGLTPQGWLRTWDENGQVQPCEWRAAETILPQVGAAVISREDVGNDEEQIEWMAHHVRLLAVTEGAAGCVLYWHGDRRRFRAPLVEEVDATGAGDIFAAAFFIRLYTTRDPWEAARFATQLAARSVTRRGLEGIPTAAEIQECLMEVLL